MVFNQVLCRTLELTPSGYSENVHSAKGFAYEVDKNFFANGSTNPENSCFGSELPTGMFDLSSCNFGAPIFMSQPHFYQADPYYHSLLNNFSNPDKNLDETKFIFEPVTGVPMKVVARFQINVKLKQVKKQIYYTSFAFYHFSGSK